MFCVSCGKELPMDANSCPACGQAVDSPDLQVPSPQQAAPLYHPLGAGEENAPVYTPPVGGKKEENPSVKPTEMGNIQEMPNVEQATAMWVAEGAAPPSGQPYGDSQMPPLAQPYGGAQIPPPTQPYGGAPMPPSAQPYGDGQMPPPPYGGMPVPPVENPGKKNKTAIIAICAVAAVAMAGLVAFFALGRSKPKNIVQSALLNTVETMSSETKDVGKKLGFEAFDSLHDSPGTMEMDFGMEIPESSFFTGGRVNLRMDMQMDFSQRRIDTEFGMGMSGANLFSGTLSMNDDVIALAMPDFYSGSYGVHTTNLGTDFNKSNLRGMMDAEKLDPELSFNYFDLLEQNKPDKEDVLFTVEELKMLGDLWEKSKVEQAGNKSQQVNGYYQDCAVYTITMPQQAVRDFLKNLQDHLEEYSKEQTELSGLNSLMGAYNDATQYGDVVGEAIYVLEDVETYLSGDVKWEVYVSDKNAVYINVEVPMDSVKSVSLEMGGENHLSDAFAMTVKEENQTMLHVAAEGNHMMKDDEFSTAILVQQYDEYEDDLLDMLDMTLRYDASTTVDNFEASGSVYTYLSASGSTQFDILGTIDVFDKGVEYDLYDISVDIDGETQNMSMRMALDTSEAVTFSQQTPAMLLDMKLLELTELQDEITENSLKLSARWSSLLA